jgi:hypothetical protein
MFVDTAMLRSGAADSRRAGEHAGDGAGHLTGSPPAAGMFGDFDAAELFHQAISSAHTSHVKTLQRHREILTAVGRQANKAASSFTAMENHNAKALRDVRCTS